MRTLFFRPAFQNAPAIASVVASVAAFVAMGGCSERIVETEAPLGGSCLGCHDGITDIHPGFALSCTDCHGGDDRVVLPARVDVRDQDLLRKSHVLPRDPASWWANGVDDDDDGRADEPGEFFDGRAVDPSRLARKNQHDSEMNRDVNYLRFLNPGDLRVAQVGCGSRNRNTNAAMVCHAAIVYDARRSMMAVNDGVPTGASYGNAQLVRAEMYGDAFAASEAGQRFDARNPRLGRYGYAFNYDAVDAAYSAADNAFDREALLALAADNDDPEDDEHEVTAAAIFDDGTDPLDAPRGRGFSRTGQRLKHYDPTDTSDNRALEVLQPIAKNTQRLFPPQGSTLELRVQKVLEGLGIARQSPIENVFDGEPVTNPVDAALRNFRAYHTLNFWGTSDNFGFVDFTESPNAADPPPADPNNVVLANNNNPFGRSRGSGCSACHVEYRKDGHSEEPKDKTVRENGRALSTDLPAGARIDRGERGHPKKHELKTAVTTETCGSCHGFVTRVDYAVSGLYEHEADLTNIEKTATLGPYSFTTPPNVAGQQSCVNVFDNLARFEDGAIVHDGEGVTEDQNGNGFLDDGEDENDNGCLDIPDRVPRSDSFDGRQSRIVYGGENGAVRLDDVHIERGMACTDCHYVWDVHGDSNIYSRNWDAVAIECDDCHGTPYGPASLVTSGPNGGDRLDDPSFATPFGEPWFERREGRLIQHSRTVKDLEWTVPELDRPRDAASAYAHRQPLESGPNADRPDEARPYAHIQEPGKPGGLECYACHSSWQPNCLTCHIKMDVAKPKQEIWFSDDDTEDITFQLFSFTRSPFYLGRAGDVEGNKIAPYRSTMQVALTVVAGSANIVDGAVFSTQEHLSSMASNPYFPHTVRTRETKSCARCHTLADAQGRIENDHFLTETGGAGTGRYQSVGDWALLATDTGMQQLDLKREAVGTVTFPGFDLDAANVRQVSLATGRALDVALVRGVSFQDGSSDVADIAIVAHDNDLSFVDVTGRDTAGLPPTLIARVDGLGPVRSLDHPDPAASQSTRVIALTDAELAVVDFRAALADGRVRDVLDATDPPPVDPDAFSQGAVLVRVGADACALPNDDDGCTLAHGLTAPTRVRLHGRFALVTHAAGLTVFELDVDDGRNAAVDPGAALAAVETFPTAQPALDVVSIGRHAYVATGAGGVVIFDVGPIVFDGVAAEAAEPTAPLATALAPDADSRGVALYGTRLLVADGANGLRVVDVSVPARAQLLLTVQDVPGQDPIDDASAVVVASVPTRHYAIVADGAHGLRAVNLTDSVDLRTQLADAANPAQHDATRAFRLSFERQDPLTPFDPKNAVRQVITYPTNGRPNAIARGFALDAIADPSGRRMRDAWSIGATSLDEATLVRMRSVLVREVAGTVDVRGDGLGCVVRDGDEGSVAFDPIDARRCLPPASAP